MKTNWMIAASACAMALVSTAPVNAQGPLTIAATLQGAGQGAGGEARERHAELNGVSVYAQDTGKVRGEISVQAFDAALSNPQLAETVKQNLRNGVQWAILTSNGGGIGIVGPGYECLREDDFNYFPQCEGEIGSAAEVTGSEAIPVSPASAPASSPVAPAPTIARLGNVIAGAEEQAPSQSATIAFVSKDGSAIMGSRSVFVLRNKQSGASIIVPVIGRDSETRAEVFVQPGTYEITPPPPSIGDFMSFSTEKVSASQIAVQANGSPAIVEFSLKATPAPVILKVKEVGPNSVSLNWGALNGLAVAGYLLEQTDGPLPSLSPGGGNSILLNSLATTSAVIGGLSPGRQYTFTLFGVSQSGDELPPRSVSVYTSREDSSSAAFALVSNTMMPSNFAELNAQAVTPNKVRVTLPSNLGRVSQSKLPGVNESNLKGSGCIAGTPFLVTTEVSPNNSFYGVVDVCETGATAIIATDVPLDAVFNYYHLKSVSEDPIPNGQAALDNVKNGSELLAFYVQDEARLYVKNPQRKRINTNPVSAQFLPAEFSSRPLALVNADFQYIQSSLMSPDRATGLVPRGDMWSVDPTRALFQTAASRKSPAVFGMAMAMASRKVSCESSGAAQISLQPNFTPVHNFDLKLNSSQLNWNITAGVKASINPIMSFSGEYSCSLDLPSRSFQLSSYPIPVNLELSPDISATATGALSIEGPELSLSAGIRSNGSLSGATRYCSKTIGWWDVDYPCGARANVSQRAEPFTTFKRGDMEAKLEGTLTFAAGLEANLGIGVKNSFVTAKTGFALNAKPLSAEFKATLGSANCASASLGYQIGASLVAEAYVLAWGETKRLDLYQSGHIGYPGANFEVCAQDDGPPPVLPQYIRLEAAGVGNTLQPNSNFLTGQTTPQGLLKLSGNGNGGEILTLTVQKQSDGTVVLQQGNRQLTVGGATERGGLLAPRLVTLAQGPIAGAAKFRPVNARRSDAGSSYVSFESVAFPGTFLRHAGYLLYVSKPGDTYFNTDATWRFAEKR